MKHIYIIAILISLSSILFSQNNNIANHNLHVKINPVTSEISVTDSIILIGDFQKEFLLNAELTPFANSKNIKVKKVANNVNASDVGMDRDNPESEANLKLTKWQIKGSENSFVISYKGKITGGFDSNKQNYQRGFSQTSGLISEKGIYLAGSTYWIPTFENSLITFSLTTELPITWKNVTQGKRTFEKKHFNKRSANLDNHIDTWICNKAQEEVFLIAAKFNEYSYDMNNGIKAMAFLRTPDEGLANKYLEVTEQYANMYESMLGKYPYSKFALVENFWETGYGMPSFTLLGEKIIRFPFILHSSYPHELLHNWWGNSVYVDFKSGNWCEGITAYMADHLIKEQRGAGEEYRRSTLQKFTNFVNPENDFPLTEFIARHDGASEAIGYGKALMMWHMLRRKVGDEAFLKTMKQFYEDYKYKTASFNDIRKTAEKVTRIDLKPFFEQWTKRKSAPEIAIKSITKDMYAGQYRINITIEQKQKEDAFNIDLPINIVTEKGLETFVFNMNKKEQSFQITLKSKPLKLVIDAQYDVFRILHPAEVPPTLSKIWGNKENIIIIPSKANKTQQRLYQKFAKQWQEADNDNFKIVFDSDLKIHPTNSTFWVLGFENTFSEETEKQLAQYNTYFDKEYVKIGKEKITKKGNSFIFTVSEKKDINTQRIFIAFDNEKAIDGLIRKLPHYGKYSYLAFKGDEPTNIAKGQWEVLNSPLVKTFEENANSISGIEERKALAELKPVFSEKRMMANVKYLASKELKGRGLGTSELEVAAKYIADKFKEAGLKPIKNGSYFQKFTHTFKDKGKLNLTNVIGIIPGTDPKLKNETVVLSAHYDHLGLGWPDVRKGNEGEIHYGADDNASGVATIIELAKSMSKTVKPKRTIVFLACTAEEAGLIGSRYYVEHCKDYFSGNIFANVNIDTDGSLFDKKLLVLNGNTAKEWKFIFMGTDYTTGVKSEVIDKELDASDQVAFIEKGIPAVQLFTGATANYHRPTDTYDKIDGKGLVKVATVAKEVITYLADREKPMNYTGKSPNENRKNNATTTDKKQRRVSTGSVPSFSYKGKGVKIASVIEGSAGDVAGLKAEDIIVGINDMEINTLKEYSDYLKEFKPNDVIILKILRENKAKNIKLKLGER